MFAILTIILRIPALITHFFFEKSKWIVLEILEHLPYVKDIVW